MKTRTVLLIVLAGLLAVAALGVGFFLSARSPAKLGPALQQRLDAIRAAGDPVTVQDLAAWYPKIPDAENAAPVYQEAFKRCAGEPPSAKELPAIGAPLPPPLRAQIEKLLAGNGPALDLLHKAAGYPRCRFDLDFSAEWSLKLPHLDAIRKCARLLMWDAALAADTGAPDRAVADIESLVALARSLHREPVFASQLTRLSLLNIAGWSLQNLLTRTALSEAQLARLFALLQAECDERAFAPALVADRAEGISTFLDLKAGTPRGDTATRAYLRHFYEADFAYYLDVMAGLIRAATAPLLDRAAIYERLVKLGEAPKGAVVSPLALPALYDYPREEHLDLTKQRAALAGIAVERWRLKHARLPDRLAETVPEFLGSVPVDARDFRPLGYEKADKGFAIFLAAPDGKPEPLSDKESAGLTLAERQAGVLFKVAR